MVVMINSECNCNCVHCYVKSSEDDCSGRKKLSPEEMKKAIAEMLENGVFHFALQGGEPILYPHLDDIIKACKPRRSYITIVTNGTLLDEQKLKHLYDLGVDKVVVSIDSFDPEEHDNFRRLKGCHKKAMEALSAARKAGLDVAIAVTVMNDTLHTDGIQKLLQYTLANDINIEVNTPQPIGNWDGRDDLILTKENFRYINDLHKNNYRIRRDLYYHMGRAGCPAVKESMYMNNYGDICPCVFMHISVGNIRDHRLRDIRCNAMSVNEFREYKTVCLAGEDRGFIKKYISKGYGMLKPADGFEIFNLKSLPRRNNYAENG